MNYDRLALTETDKQELASLRAYYPFRKWIIVKPEMAETGFFYSGRKANAYAKKHAPAAIYK